ncbi:MAG: hypothetical protein AB7T38_02385 [Nitrospirales bacterium]
MERYQVGLLKNFFEGEKDLAGRPVDWSQYYFLTMQELDRVRDAVGSRCTVIRGSHGSGKETAVDAVFPAAKYSTVVMALMRSGCSKGFYQGGSIHLDHVMGAGGLARCWLAFKPSAAERIANRGLIGLRAYARDGWDYYQWGHPRSWDLLNYLVDLNEGNAA